MKYKIQFIPSLFTTLNLFFGFVSIIKALDNHIHAAAWFIILAVLCDGMDGKIARITNSETNFGFELDSLADMISFALAPMIIVYLDGLNQLGLWGVIFTFLYLFGGAYRLARFNVQQAGDRSHGYIGLPIPIAAIWIASFSHFKDSLGSIFHFTIWIPMVLIVAIIMVSTIHYDWPQVNFQGGWKKKVGSGSIFLGLTLLAFLPERSLFPVITFYIFIGVLRSLIGVFKKEANWVDFFVSMKKH